MDNIADTIQTIEKMLENILSTLLLLGKSSKTAQKLILKRN